MAWHVHAGQTPILPPAHCWEYYSGTPLDTSTGVQYGRLEVRACDHAPCSMRHARSMRAQRLLRPLPRRIWRREPPLLLLHLDTDRSRDPCPLQRTGVLHGALLQFRMPLRSHSTCATDSADACDACAAGTCGGRSLCVRIAPLGP